MTRASRPVLGAVLVGGASSRFGSDKAAARWAGATLADHAAAAIAPFCAAVVRVGGGDVPDLPRAGLGPLGGVAAALHRGGRDDVASVLTIACDMPRVPAALVEALLRRAPAYCADAPVLGHWPVELAAGLIDRLSEAALAVSARPASASLPAPGSSVAVPTVGEGEGRRHRRSGALSLRRWAEEIGALPINSPTPLANVNTFADLMAL